jgi:hypothetical protein
MLKYKINYIEVVLKGINTIANFTGWFLDIRISKTVHVTMYPEALP